MNSETTLALNGVGKAYADSGGQPILALTNITFSVNKGGVHNDCRSLGLWEEHLASAHGRSRRSDKR